PARAAQVPVGHRQGAQGAAGARRRVGVTDTRAFLDVLQGFVHELRTVGLPVSMTENLDAMRAIEHVDIADRDVFRAILSATLVKHSRHQPAFDTAFDVYFSLYRAGVFDADSPAAAVVEADARADGGGAPMSRDELTSLLFTALMTMDLDAPRRLARIAVDQFAGMEPGRPVGGTYYVYRTLRALDFDGLRARLMDLAADEGDALGERLARDEYEARLREMREIVEEEIRRRLVA